MQTIHSRRDRCPPDTCIHSGDGGFCKMLPIGKAEVCRTLLIGNPECHRVYPPLPPDPLLQGTHCPLCRQPIPQREGLTEPATAHPGTIPGEAADRILGRFTRKD